LDAVDHHIGRYLVGSGRAGAHEMILDVEAAGWAIHGQPYHADLWHRGRVVRIVPIIFDATVTTDYGLFSTFIASDRGRQHFVLTD
jgi:hypothetical protein